MKKSRNRCNQVTATSTKKTTTQVKATVIAEPLKDHLAK